MRNLFGERVDQRIEELKINRTELARRLGVDLPVVSQTLNEGRNPQRKTLERWAAALETSADWLLGLEPAKPVPQVFYQSKMKIGPTDAELDALVDMAAALGVDDKRLDLIAFLLVANEPAVSVLAKAKGAIKGADAARLPGRKKGAV